MPAGIDPLAPLTGNTEKPEPLHTAVEISVITGFGFSITVIVNGFPVQLPDTGTTV